MENRRLRVAVIGGGSGIYSALLGLKKLPIDLTAIVTMMDTGGSSGRLRDELGLLPPGDVRQCLAALAADDEGTLFLRQLFSYRFAAGPNLGGHSFGNLFLSALADITGGMDRAIEEAGRILAVRGRVLPVTLDSSQLCARLVDGTIIRGEANIDVRQEEEPVPIDHVYLEPRASVHAPVADELEHADVVVLGPGDLYTSVIPNLLVEGVPQAISRSPATKVYVCNLMTKHGESDGFRTSDFIREVLKYLGPGGNLDCAIVNEGPLPQDVVMRYREERAVPVEADLEECERLVAHVLHERLASVKRLVRHDPGRLAKAILRSAQAN
jgi:uncharacterized cofD-like protein